MTHWSSRLLAQHLGISDATVVRAWREYGVAPWRSETFTFSTDPELVAKVTDVVGLYLAPPQNAVALCVDEKSQIQIQIQALDRTAPMLLMQPGLPQRRTHDYVRHGTTTLFAALNIAAGKVTAMCLSRHPPPGVFALPRSGRTALPRPRAAPGHGQLRCHKRVEVRNWLAANPRISVHFTPTCASWMNLVEVWFGIIERQAIHRGTFASVKDLTRRIRTFIDGWNDKAHPFIWTKTAEQILAKANRKKTSDAVH